MKKITFILFTMLVAGSAVGQNISIGTNMVVEPGTQLHVDANLSINAAEMLIKQDATLIMGNNKTLGVNNSAGLRLEGNESNQALVTSAGYFLFIINDGGTIGASYATFEKMSGNGLTIENGATVDPDNPLSNCTFQNGSNGSTLLTINNHQHLTIEGAVFISTPNLELYNVAKTLNQGIVNFINYGGDFVGEDFEDDEFNRIFWNATEPFEQLATGAAGGGAVLCYDALDVITVEDYLIQSGCVVDMIAGQRILMLPGVIVQSGGKLHAWISTDGIFCHPPSMLASSEPQLERSDSDSYRNPHRVYEVGAQPFNPHETAIKIYPNPTTGDFTLQLHGFEESEMVLVQIFNMQGKLLSAQELPASSLYSMSLAGRQPGIYLIKVVQGGSLGVGRIIKQ